MDHSNDQQALIDLRREFHRTPEIGWAEFMTTARIVSVLREYGFEVLLGAQAIALEEALGRDPEVVAAGLAHARAPGVDATLLDEMRALPG